MSNFQVVGVPTVFWNGSVLVASDVDSRALLRLDIPCWLLDIPLFPSPPSTSHLARRKAESSRRTPKPSPSANHQKTSAALREALNISEGTANMSHGGKNGDGIHEVNIVPMGPSFERGKYRHMPLGGTRFIVIRGLIRGLIPVYPRLTINYFSFLCSHLLTPYLKRK